VLPDTGEDPAAVLARSLPVTDSRCVAYLATRRIPVEIAAAEDVRFCEHFNGRPAVVAAMRDRDGRLLALTGRYTVHDREGGKILTFGRPGGAFSVAGGLEALRLVLVEGVFDALSLASCGVPCVATIGSRYVPWMPEHAASRTVLLAFDGNRVGNRTARSYEACLRGARCVRFAPPQGCKDWNAVLKKRGSRFFSEWLAAHPALRSRE
jgi:hypothetical protein